MRSAADYTADAILTPRRRPAEEWEEPAAVSAVTHALPSGNVVSTWGDTGPAVLLVHGWEGRSTQFAGLIRAVVAGGRRAVAVDAPGHGRSPDGEFSPVRHGEALLEALPRFAPFDALVTHSFGSTSAFHAMRHGLAVNRMALISPLVSLSGRLTKFAEQVGMAPAQRAEFLAVLQERLGVPVPDLDIDTLPEPAVPVLLCHDADDREVPAAPTRTLAELWPNATLLLTTGLRHRRILTEPAVVKAVAAHIGCTPQRILEP
ncbi:hypothetical protein BJF78_31635 [Pseudonocardia sp. CNS-139]|nr:hypothetical protein BJF78_31635 [Pseudonocardia sp. CNS-139]